MTPKNSTRCWYCARHLEVAEDQREDEEVVDRQALLEQPRGRVLHAGVAPRHGEDDDAEDDGQADPADAPAGGLLEADDVGVAVGQQVDGQGDDDGGGEAAHSQRGRRARGLLAGGAGCPLQGRAVRGPARRGRSPDDSAARVVAGRRQSAGRGSAPVEQPGAQHRGLQREAVGRVGGVEAEQLADALQPVGDGADRQVQPAGGRGGDPAARVVGLEGLQQRAAPPGPSAAGPGRRRSARRSRRGRAAAPRRRPARRSRRPARDRAGRPGRGRRTACS